MKPPAGFTAIKAPPQGDGYNNPPAPPGARHDYPRHILRVVFALSALACSVILVLFVRGRAEWSDAFWLQLAAASRCPVRQPAPSPSRDGRLRLDGVPMLRFVLVFVRELATIYIVSGVAVTAIALAVIYGVTRSGANALALAVLAGLWLSCGSRRASRPSPPGAGCAAQRLATSGSPQAMKRGRHAWAGDDQRAFRRCSRAW